MDLSLPIVGLMAFIGYKLNDEKTPRNKKKERDYISPHEKPSGKNIYYSTYSKEINNNEQELANKMFEKSKDPINTNIIPPLYNSYCKWDCDRNKNKHYTSNNKDDMILPSLNNNSNENNEKELMDKKQKQIISGPMFRELDIKGITIDPTDTTSGGFKSIYKNINSVEKFDNIVSDLTGKPMELTHNNMVPFYGSNVTQNTDIGKVNMVDYYNGSNTINNKREVKQMYTNKQENIYGSRPLGDTIAKDRFVQSTLKTNLLPIPQVKVQPISSDYIRPLYKDVDDLRVKTNPKVSYNQLIIKGKSLNSTRGLEPSISKNRPDTFYVNSSDRYFTTVGVQKAQTLRENYDNLKYTSRSILTEKTPQLNPAYNPGRSQGKIQLVNSSNNNKSVFNSLVTDPKRQNFKQDWIRNSKSIVNVNNCLNRKGYIANEQERETTNRMHLLPAYDVDKGRYQSEHYEAKPTHKENQLFSYTGNAVIDVDKPMDYTSAYNNTNERQWIDSLDYKGTPLNSTMGVTSTLGYDNLQINSNRQDIIDRRGYTSGPQKENIPLGAAGINIYQRDDSIHKALYDYNANVNRLNVEPTSLFNLGYNTDTSNKDTTEHDFIDRIQPEILDAYKSNPYTKSLNSY